MKECTTELKKKETNSSRILNLCGEQVPELHGQRGMWNLCEYFNRDYPFLLKRLMMMFILGRVSLPLNDSCWWFVFYPSSSFVANSCELRRKHGWVHVWIFCLPFCATLIPFSASNYISSNILNILPPTLCNPNFNFCL